MQNHSITFVFINKEKNERIPVEVQDTTTNFEEVLNALEQHFTYLKTSQLGFYMKDLRNDGAETPFEIRRNERFPSAIDVYNLGKGVGWRENQEAEIIVKKRFWSA